MTINEIITWAVIILVMSVLIYIIIQNDNSESYYTNEYMINIPRKDHNAQWIQSSKCNYLMDDTTKKVLDTSNIKKTSNSNDADIFFPCGYNNIDDEIKSLPNVYYKDDISNYHPKRVLIIEGADEITAKNYLWKNIYNHHGIKKAKEMSPNTYLLAGPQRYDDIIRLETEHIPGKLYIMKKNVQNQTGLEITDDISFIKKNTGGYVLVQELLQDPYILNRKKINLRVYVVVVCNKDKTDVYLFNNGFMYYTKQNFIKGSKDKDNHITTGYVERDIYHKNPLTHTDFKMYLDSSEGSKYHPTSEPRKHSPTELSLRNQGFKISDIIFKRIERLMTDVLISFKGYICRKFDDIGDPVPIYDDYSVQIFGADVAINDQLQPQIIEINKGPDLSSKDDRDGIVKRKMFGDVLEMMGIKPMSQDNGLSLILEM